MAITTKNVSNSLFGSSSVMERRETYGNTRSMTEAVSAQAISRMKRPICGLKNDMNTRNGCAL